MSPGSPTDEDAIRRRFREAFMRIALGIVNRRMATEGFVQAIDTERYRERRLQAQYIAWSTDRGRTWTLASVW